MRAGGVCYGLNYRPVLLIKHYYVHMVSTRLRKQLKRKLLSAQLYTRCGAVPNQLRVIRILCFAAQRQRSSHLIEWPHFTQHKLHNAIPSSSVLRDAAQWETWDLYPRHKPCNSFHNHSVGSGLSSVAKIEISHISCFTNIVTNTKNSSKISVQTLIDAVIGMI